MAKGLGAMVSGAAGDGKTWNRSASAICRRSSPPSTAGRSSKPTGEKISAPFRYSNAEVTYRKDDARIVLKLADSGFNQLFFAPFTMLMQAGYEKETQDGYEKSTTIAGQPGFEKWNSERKDGELDHGRRQALPALDRRQPPRRHQDAARRRRQDRHGEAGGR